MFQQAITNFNINYDVYNESRTFFSGDRVTGNISFELKKEIKISTISMEFRGMAHVHWSSGGGGKKRRRRHYSAKLDYFRIKSSILQDSGGMQTLQPFAAELRLKLLMGKCLICFLLQQQLGNSDFSVARMYIRSHFRSRKGVYVHAPLIVYVVSQANLVVLCFRVLAMFGMTVHWIFRTQLSICPLFCPNVQACLKEHCV